MLFVLPSEVLVWQIAATVSCFHGIFFSSIQICKLILLLFRVPFQCLQYYEFFKGNVTIATDLITFQEIFGGAEVYNGTLGPGKMVD